MTARELFEEARRCAARIEELHRELAEGGPPRGSGGAGRPAGGVGDPTAWAAEAAIEWREDIERERAACEQVVGEALEVIEGVRQAFEESDEDRLRLMWLVLDLFYIDGKTWDEASGEMGVSPRTCRDWRDVALDWVDHVGIARAKMGVGCAEGMDSPHLLPSATQMS